MRLAVTLSMASMAALVLALAPAPAAARAQYMTVHLGQGVVVTDINNRPQVVGYDLTSGELLVWDGSGRHGLGVRIDPSVAPRINDQGVIVAVRPMDAGSRLFAVVNGIAYDLPPLPGDGVQLVSALTNINTLLVQGRLGAWLFSDGAWTNVAAMTGADIRAINEAGTMAGGTINGSSFTGPYLRYADGGLMVPWTSGPAIALLASSGHFVSVGDGAGATPYWWAGTPDGTVTKVAEASILLRDYQPLDINASGDVVGVGQWRRLSPFEPWYPVGFVRSNGETTWLPLDRAVAINDAGLIVGSTATGAVVLLPASSPSGVAFTVRDRVVTLTWQPTAGALEYIVEAGSTSGAADLYDASIGVQPRLVTAAPPGRYYVRVRARTPAGLTPPSQEVVIDVP